CAAARGLADRKECLSPPRDRVPILRPGCNPEREVSPNEAARAQSSRSPCKSLSLQVRIHRHSPICTRSRDDGYISGHGESVVPSLSFGIGDKQPLRLQE